MSTIFISHAKADRIFVEDELLGMLKALGFNVWFAEQKITSPEQWERSIRSGLESSEWFLIILSFNSVKSEWVKNELAWAFNNLPHRIVPILIDNCQLTDFHLGLPRIQYIDYRTSKEWARERLIECLVNGEYRSRSMADKITGLMDCPSKEILTVIKNEKSDNGSRAIIIGANSHANEFFGRRKGLSIIGLDASGLLEIIRHWMDQDDFEKFEADQSRLGEALKRGEEIFARVPIKINNKHPIKRMRGHRFFLTTIAYSYPEDHLGKTVEYYLVMYLDLDDVLTSIKD